MQHKKLIYSTSSLGASPGYGIPPPDPPVHVLHGPSIFLSLSLRKFQKEITSTCARDRDPSIVWLETQWLCNPTSSPVQESLGEPGLEA